MVLRKEVKHTPHKDIRTPTSVQEGTSKNRDAFFLRDETSLGFLQDATDFAIHDGSIASIGGDSFTARRDVHVTINHHHSSISSSSLSAAHIPDDNQKRESKEMSTANERHFFTEDTLILPLLPVQRSCDIYRRHLATKGRGMPLWIPEPSKNLPIQYQRKGFSIGDVGIITASGSFTFLFSICLPKDHPINPPVMPEGFEPLGSEAMLAFNVDVQREFKENSYLASASSVRARRDGDSTGLIFESSEHDGAILTMPVGSKSEDLVNIARFRKYVTKNLKSWYHYAYHDRDFEVRNGDLRVVTGCDKTSAWGMATFFNSGAGCSSPGPSSRRDSDSLLAGGEPKFHLEFGPIENDRSTSGEGTVKRYGWECSGMAEVRAGPDASEVWELRGGGGEEEDTVFENQCLFVRTLNATLPERVWQELGFEEEEEESFDGYRPKSMDADEGRASSSPPSSSGRGGGASGGSAGASSSLLASKSQISASRSIIRKDSVANGYNAASVYSSQISLANHPSIAINELLLKNCSDDITVAFTLDQDWMSVVRADDFVLPSSDELLERIMQTYVIREEDGIVFLDSKCEEGPCPISSFAILEVDDISNQEEKVKDHGESINFDAIGLDALGNLDPSLSSCVDILTSTYRQLENVKVCRNKCKDLCDRSSRLLLELQGLNNQAPDTYDEVDAVIMHIHEKIEEWGSWNKMKSILRQGEIRKDLERLCDAVDGSSMKLHVQLFTGQQLVVQHTINSISTAVDDTCGTRRHRLIGHAFTSLSPTSPFESMHAPNIASLEHTYSPEPRKDEMEPPPLISLIHPKQNQVDALQYPPVFGSQHHPLTNGAQAFAPGPSYRLGGYPPGIERGGSAAKELFDPQELRDDAAADIERLQCGHWLLLLLHFLYSSLVSPLTCFLQLCLNLVVEVYLHNRGRAWRENCDTKESVSVNPPSPRFKQCRDATVPLWITPLHLVEDWSSALRDKGVVRRDLDYSRKASLQKCIQDALRRLEDKTCKQDPDRIQRRPVPAELEDFRDIVLGGVYPALRPENFRSGSLSHSVTHRRNHHPAESNADDDFLSIGNNHVAVQDFTTTFTIRNKNHWVSGDTSLKSNCNRARHMSPQNYTGIIDFFPPGRGRLSSTETNFTLSKTLNVVLPLECVPPDQRRLHKELSIQPRIPRNLVFNNSNISSSLPGALVETCWFEHPTGPALATIFWVSEPALRLWYLVCITVKRPILVSEMDN